MQSSGVQQPSVAQPTRSPVASSLAQVRSAALLRLVLILAVDGLYVLGVLLPYLTRDGDVAADWLPASLGLLVVLTAFLLPWVTFGLVAVTGYRMWQPDVRGPSRGVDLYVLLLSAAGFLTYFSPWGVSALRWLLD